MQSLCSSADWVHAIVRLRMDNGTYS